MDRRIGVNMNSISINWYNTIYPFGSLGFKHLQAFLSCLARVESDRVSPKSPWAIGDVLQVVTDFCSLDAWPTEKWCFTLCFWHVIWCVGQRSPEKCISTAASWPSDNLRVCYWKWSSRKLVSFPLEMVDLAKWWKPLQEGNSYIILSYGFFEWGMLGSPGVTMCQY